MHTDATAYAEVVARRVPLHFDFLTIYRRAMEQQMTTSRAAEVAHDYFMRSLSWVGSLCVLQHPSHVQAVIAGSRATFEAAVDMTLLTAPNGPWTPDMVLFWEHSAKLRSWETAVGYAEATGDEQTLDVEGLRGLIGLHAEGIRDERRKRYPHGPGKSRKTDRQEGRFHPSRWTDRNLFRDSNDADGIAPEAGFRRYYAAVYPRVNWAVHGSGSTAFRGIPEDSLPAMLAFATREVIEFTTIVGERCLELAGLATKDSEKHFSEYRHEVHERILGQWTIERLLNIIRRAQDVDEVPMGGEPQ